MGIFLSIHAEPVARSISLFRLFLRVACPILFIFPGHVLSANLPPQPTTHNSQSTVLSHNSQPTTHNSPSLVPPVLVQKEIWRWPEPPAGEVTTLKADGDTTFVLFIPANTAFNADGTTTLAIHFHGTAWFMQQEHVRRGATHPLLTANSKKADAAYEIDIMSSGTLASLLKQTAEALAKSSGHPGARIGRLELSGFSAGYAGVRGVLRLPEFEPRVASVLLSDSLYTRDGPDSKPPEIRKPSRGLSGIDPFLDFARKAAAGERALLMEFSSTPSLGSVGPMDCARTIIDALGILICEVPLNSIPAASETADYQLMWRADSGGAHFWCYRAAERPIHLSHIRNTADMWRALDGLTSAAPIPPAMTPRPIKPPENLDGDIIALDIGTTGTVSLYLPPGFKTPKNGEVELTVHFHGTRWFVIQEHLRRGMGDALVTLELGQGSTVYRTPFLDAGRFGRLLDAVAAELKKRGGPPETRVASVNITSFSAGYGAVREIIKSPENVARIKRIVLGDSSYGSLDEAPLKEGKRVVAPEHVEPWANFARLAMTGKKTLLMTTSDITPASYAGTYEVVRAVAAALNLKPLEVAPGSVPAASADQKYPLYMQADAGGFHWWAYRGDDAVVHMTLARHIADAWSALDQCGNP